jgi:putative protein-disulfide isomerase
MKLLYVYDALCGWCYGFSPVMTAFKEAHQNELDFEIVSGGMIVNDRVGPIGEVAGYISEAYKQVEKTTGVKFGEGFLNGVLKEGTATFTSIPPAIAMSIVKDFKPESSIEFAEAMQRAIYFEGILPDDQQAYVQLAMKFGLNGERFADLMDSDEYLQKAEKDFAHASELNVTGFPTVLLIDGNSYAVLARGYTSLEMLEERYEHVKIK